ncbi:MAG: hypothetical protein QXY40_08235 [Candidatus Methanomethylicia archaeon]
MEMIIPGNVAVDLSLTRKLLLTEEKLEKYRGAGRKSVKPTFKTWLC